MTVKGKEHHSGHQGLVWDDHSTQVQDHRGHEADCRGTETFRRQGERCGGHPSRQGAKPTAFTYAYPLPTISSVTPSAGSGQAARRSPSPGNTSQGQQSHLRNIAGDN